MSNHPREAALQTTCICILEGGLDWPKEVQTQAGYVPGRAVDLTKMAMTCHLDSIELQVKALHALSSYLEKLHCHRLVKVGGGEGLIKAVMTRHPHDAKLQTWGGIVLDGIGESRFWAPKGAGADAEEGAIEEASVEGAILYPLEAAAP